MHGVEATAGRKRVVVAQETWIDVEARALVYLSMS
jgi:hypothetical protein